MIEGDYLLWLSYESSRRILFPEGVTTIGSEMFQGPIIAMQVNCDRHYVETTIRVWQHNCGWAKFAKLKFSSNRVRTQTIAVTCDCTSHYTSIC